MDIRFQPSSQAPASVEAQYSLANTGTQPLASLEVRLPRSSVLHLLSPGIQWDGQPISFDRREDPAGDVLQLNFAQPWPVKQTRSLTVKYEVAQGAPDTSQLDFVADSFYLPPGDAVPSLLPPKGTFASGGAAPKKWILSVRVPQDFLVHAPGHPKRQRKENAELRADFEQRPGDLAPFVVAGRYHVWEYRESHEPVIFWKKTPPQPAELEPLARDVAHMIQTYDSLFGPRAKHALPVWIADSPIPTKEPRKNTPEGFSSYTVFEPPPDFGFIDFWQSGERVWDEKLARRVIGEVLAKAWLEREPGLPRKAPAFPLRVLPTYALLVADEVTRGAPARESTIESTLMEYDHPLPGFRKSGESYYSSKDILFFYALEDQFGRDHLHAALRNMVQARRGRGYDLDDLIAALEAEAGKPVAPFVRLWLKHPGIPDEFRARYAAPAAAANAAPKEKPQ